MALTGTTAYAIALLSYTDNRSSTYLLPYVALPLLMAGALWLALLLRSPSQASSAARRGGLAFALAVAVLLIAVAWPRAGAAYPTPPWPTPIPAEVYRRRCTVSGTRRRSTHGPPRASAC